jgi:hypothetical protein
MYSISCHFLEQNSQKSTCALKTESQLLGVQKVFLIIGRDLSLIVYYKPVNTAYVADYI